VERTSIWIWSCNVVVELFSTGAAEKTPWAWFLLAMNHVTYAQKYAVYHHEMKSTMNNLVSGIVG
jgi:hypothetical protein